MVLYWSALLLPVVYLVLLVTGIQTTEKLLAFLGLVGMHVIALLGGQSYRPSAE